uniref:Phosphorylase b kinase regulatory subunit n=1 Tax=Ascaris lumbricoides TaxID=6252 RepID=A0A9J2P4L3_ASCLU
MFVELTQPSLNLNWLSASNLSRPAKGACKWRAVTMSDPRGHRRSGTNSRLRRFTQPYLTSAHHLQPKLVKTVLEQVDSVYRMVQQIILDHQSVTSGLFPRYSKDRNIGYAKDSIYCALACWACSVAYKRLDDDRGRQTELRQSAVKAMRGIMFAWMQQLDNLNKFKDKNSPEYALHSRFDLHTGMMLESPNDKAYGHLQMDLIALYLLALVQMTAGGVQIIYTHDEVCFVQNLVFYIERTYRTPDFGMWERGTRYNVGEPELHASSLGMVKAALEAINGFNLYGASGTSASVIYVDIDGHNRNRTTFETILPRESNSKNTDAALLLAVGWPAFASHDPQLFERAVSKCIRRLEGKYGMKRFFRDGYHTELEDASRHHYDVHETCRFQDIECQFPMFFAFLTITSQLRGDEESAKKYWDKLKDLLVSADDSSHLVLPECYIIEEENMVEEREKPNSQEFYAASPNEFGHHLWSNAVYIVALLLRNQLIHASDIDPIYRHLPASQRPSNPNRHSAFQGSMEGNPVVQVALIAESSRLQMMLSTYGISTQTPHELEPVQIWPSWRMVKVFESLGKNAKLGLGGRPPRPFGPLNTSKIFKLFGDTILCYPLLFEVKDFYINADPAVLIDDIKLDLEFISKRWKLAGRPTFCLVLREENVSGEYFSHMLDLLVSMKNGFVNGVRVRIGRVHQLLNTGCTEHVDFATSEDASVAEDAFEELGGKTSQMISRTSLRDVVEEDVTSREQDFLSRSDQELYELVKRHDVDNLRVVAFANAVLCRRYGSEFQVDGETLATRMERVYRQACAWRLWWLVRFCAAKLRKTMNSLAPGITDMLVRGKQVTLGVRGCREVTISSPMTPDEITGILFSSCPDNEPQAAVLQQELIIACSDLICKKPYAFDGVLTIRLSWLSDAISLMLDYLQSAKAGDRSPHSRRVPPTTPTRIGLLPKFKQERHVYDLSPTELKDVVAALLTRKNWHLLTPLQSRRLNGSLNRVPTNLYDSVWKILERTEGGLVIAGHYLPQQPTLSDMTQFELTFAYKIESMMSVIAHPEYRQVLVELLCIVAVILERNRELLFAGKLDCDRLVRTAFCRYCEEQGISDRNDMTPFYQLDDSDLTARSTANYLVRTVIDVLLSGATTGRRKLSTFMPSDKLSTADRPDEQINSCIVA